jgi:ABC-type sugar transport system ATPase subunit
MSDPLLQVTSLSKRYGSLEVLEDITFTLDKGEILGLVGRRGAGKTSLLHAIGGVSPPTGGEIFFHGRKISISTPAEAREEGIEFIHQIPHITEMQDVLNNIFLGREICWPAKIGLPNMNRMYERARDLLTDFDLPASLLQERAGNLNDEQRQVVAIARSLCFPPRLLLIDDSLDPAAGGSRRGHYYQQR